MFEEEAAPAAEELAPEAVEEAAPAEQLLRPRPPSRPKRPKTSSKLDLSQPKKRPLGDPAAFWFLGGTSVRRGNELRLSVRRNPAPTPGTARPFAYVWRFRACGAL